MTTVDEFNKWFDALKPIDKMNFETLIGLPKAEEIINRMEDGDYKRMALFCVNSVEELFGLKDLKKELESGGPEDIRPC